MAIGLYIHIPFCIKKCAYCDFVSFTEGDYDAYLTALLDEMKKYKGEAVDTVFIGGGTPTALSEKQLQRLLDAVNDTFIIEKDAEFTVEANPGTLSEEKLEVLKSGGVNRLSIGVQSFDDRLLKIIGRIHDAKTAVETVNTAKKYFDNINIDIMSALPESDLKSFIDTLKTAVSLGTTHISCYSLILEEGTPLYDKVEKGEICVPDEDTEREMYEQAVSFLKEKSFERYEISNFSKSGFESRHNLKYWNTDDYIGVGLAAHSLINGKRYENTCNMKKYLTGEYLENSFELSEKDRKTEYIIMRFRLSKGICVREYKERFSGDFYSEYNKQTDKFMALGLIEKTETGYKLTDNGISVSNTILAEYV